MCYTVGLYKIYFSWILKFYEYALVSFLIEPDYPFFLLTNEHFLPVALNSSQPSLEYAGKWFLFLYFSKALKTAESF